MQYVYFPTVFYHSMYGNDELKMPLVSTGALCDYIAGRDVKNKAAMLELLQKLQQLWQLPEGECLQQLQDICTAFNSHRLDTTAVAQILLFEEVPQVFEYIKQQIWCEEVFYEDFGCSYSWLEKLCQSFTTVSYTHLTFSAEPKTVKELDRVMKITDEILRHMIIRKGE